MDKPNKNKKNKTVYLWIYKAVAIVAAVLIWAVVTMTQNPLDEKIFMISLEQRSLPESLILEKNISQVQVRVQGTAAVINDLTAADIATYVDLEGFNAGQYELEIMVEHPDNVQILSRRPASIEVELKETLTVTFPLFLDVLGEPAAGFKMMEALVSPAEVKLTGADDYIRRIARVYVAASIQDEEESYEKDLSVLVQDTTGNDISAMFTIDPRIARVVVPVMSEQPMRHLAVRVPFSGQTALGYQLSLISTTPSIVQVFGDLNRLQALDYVDTETVDISDWKTDTSLTAKLAPANGFTVYPREVTVALKIEPINSATVVKSIIIGQNIGEDCIAEVEQLTLTIMVYGPETFIASLDEADIVPYVDCEGLGGGEYELPVRVSLPANIILTNISQDTVFVTIIGPEKEDIDGDAPDTEAVDE